MATQIQRVFIDTNILLEILFHRQRATSAIDVLGSFERQHLCTSVLSIDVVMYYVERKKVLKNTARAFLSKYEVLGMSQSDIDWAYDNDQGGYEDALQVACARRHNCSVLITLDQKFEKMYGEKIAVQTIK